MTLTEIQDKFIFETKYSKLYLSIVSNAQLEKRVKLKKNQEGYIYFEAHHILPKSLFEEFSSFKSHPWNKILLTAREHFISHILLWKHYKSLSLKKEQLKMYRAFYLLSKQHRNNSKKYEYAKGNLYHTEETRKRLSVPNMKKANYGESNGMYNKTHSTEIKDKIRKNMEGKVIVKDGEGNKFSIYKNDIRYINGELIPLSRGRKYDGKNCGLSGASNKNAKTIQIYDNNDKLRYTSVGNFRVICETNNLPYTPLVNTIFKNKPISNRFKKYIDYEGWYAKVKLD